MADASGDVVVGIDIPPGTVGALGHPPMIAFDQPSLERTVRAAAVSAGVQFRLGSDVTNLTIDEAADTATVTLGDGSTLVSRWVVGADGAKSSVRDMVDIAMTDQAFDQTWLVVDTTLLDPELPLPVRARQLCAPDRITTFVPGHDTRRRWEFQLQADETREDALAPGFLEALLGGWGTSEQLQIDRKAVYRFHATVAETFRRGPVFLAGDAAHQMPPFNGQGMCCGMRDAENLAWKLAAVKAAVASPKLLDTYDAERRPHATQQVAHSADAGKLMEAIAHDGERALESGYGHRKFPKLEHGLVEGDHPLVGAPLPAPRDASFTISNGWTLLVGPDATAVPTAWNELGAASHAIAPSAYGDLVATEATIIVRPDRFVAAVTTNIEATTQYLLSHLR